MSTMPKPSRDDAPQPSQNDAQARASPNPGHGGPDAATPPLAASGVVLSDAERAAIRAAVLAMPPLTDDQTDAIVTLLTVLRERRQRQAPRPDDGPTT